MLTVCCASAERLPIASNVTKYTVYARSAARDHTYSRAEGDSTPDTVLEDTKDVPAPAVASATRVAAVMSDRAAE